MEIDITRFVENNKVAEGTLAPLLTTPKQIDTLREYAADSGVWDDAEIAAWTDAECNTLFIQLIRDDMREAGMDECDLEDFDWEQHQDRAERGTISGRIYRGHRDDGTPAYYYYLGNDTEEQAKYWVKPYDGEGGTSLATLEAVPVGPFHSLDDARAWVKKRLGGDFGQWDGLEADGDVECWHESENEGCGGLAITTRPY